MVALALLAVIGTTLVLGRLFLNGAREAEAETAAVREPPTAVESRVPGRRRRAAVATPAPTASPSTGERWPGGPCPACGNQVGAGAKFCGECGNRLAA